MNIKTEKNFVKAAKIAPILNFALFFVEFFVGLHANSMALITDSFDFLGDSLNYFIAIYLLNKSAKMRSYAALIKAFSMLIFATIILYNIAAKAQHPTLPHSNLMISMSFLALFVNLFVSYLLFSFKSGDSNQKSVWLCSRNDAINNIMVIIAGFAVSFFGKLWPDLAAAVVMVILVVSSAFVIVKQALQELRVVN